MREDLQQKMSKTKKVALITGITGQDGSYLTELLLEKVENNPFLEKFYDNPEQLALATQLYFLLIRSRQIQAINQQSIFWAEHHKTIGN